MWQTLSLGMHENNLYNLNASPAFKFNLNKEHKNTQKGNTYVHI